MDAPNAVEEYYSLIAPYWCPDCEDEHDWDIGRGMTALDRDVVATTADAILALSRLVAKYKWQRDEAVSVWAYANWEASEKLDKDDEVIAVLDRRWEDRPK